MRLRERVLLTAEPGDEAPTAHQPAVFESPQRPLDLAPRDADRVVEREVAEHHAPAVQQQLGDRFGELVAVDVGAGAGTSDQRPAAAPGEREPRSEPGEAAGVGAAAPAVAAHARADRAEAVGGERPRATPSQSARSMSSGSRLVTSPSSGAKHAPRSRSTSTISAVAPTHGSAGIGAGAGGFEQPREVVAVHDGDRRGLRRRTGGGVGVVACARREPQPAHLAVVAEPVEPGRVVVAQPARRAGRAPRPPPPPRSPGAVRARRPARPHRRAGCRARRAASGAGSA